MNIHVSIICHTEATCAAVAAPDPLGLGAVIKTHTGGAQTLADVLMRDQPDIALLELPDGSDHALDQIELAIQHAPSTHLVLVSDEHSEAFLLRAMRAGVREVMPGPLNPYAVQLAVKHARLTTSKARAHNARQGKVIALIPAKGGAGATFLATNLAFTLSKMAQRVLVLDLNLYFGDASVFLGDKKVIATVDELAGQMQRLDATLLDAAMIKVSANLHILPAPEMPVDVTQICTPGIEKIIALARDQYDFVIVDVSSDLDGVALTALDHADLVYLTLQLNLPFIRAAKHMARVFRNHGYTRDKLKLIVNRYEAGGTIDLSDVENSTQLKVHLTIPNSHTAVNESINQGIPLLELTPRDPVSRALHSWAESLAPSLTLPRPKGWLHRLIDVTSPRDRLIEKEAHHEAARPG